MRSGRTSIFVCLALAALILSGCAASQDELNAVYRQGKQIQSTQGSLESRVADIEARLDKSRAQREQEMDSLRAQVAEMRVLADSVREEMRKVMGKLEETAYAHDNKTQDLAAQDESIQDSMTRVSAKTGELSDRILRVEAFLGMETAMPEPAPETPTATAPAAPEGITPTETAAPATPSIEGLDEADAYSLAKKNFDQGRLETARDLFKQYLSRFPDAKNADNAIFWTGETYFLEKWYEKAILEYQKVIEKYPKGNKVPASLLKQGMAFDRLDDKDNARLILNELIRKHPGSPEALVAKKLLKNL